jgi:hypothetical protein
MKIPATIYDALYSEAEKWGGIGACSTCKPATKTEKLDKKVPWCIIGLLNSFEGLDIYRYPRPETASMAQEITSLGFSYGDADTILVDHLRSQRQDRYTKRVPTDEAFKLLGFKRGK